MLPRITVSMLLKSCAMPPESRPTASIFCAWRSACSVDSRRLTSCCSRSVRRSAMTPRPTARSVAGRPKIRWLAMVEHPGADDGGLFDADGDVELGSFASC